MAMTVQRRKDSKLPRVFMHKVADIRGGVSVKTSELGGDFLHEGSILSAPDGGICHVVKIARIVANVEAADVNIKVKKGHNFAKGNYVMADEGGKAYAITAIDTASSKEYDTITIGTALGKISTGEFLIEAAAESATTTSKLKYTPLSVVGTGKPIQTGQNIDTDAWLIGVTKNNPLPACVAKHIVGIINY